MKDVIEKLRFELVQAEQVYKRTLKSLSEPTTIVCEHNQNNIVVAFDKCIQLQAAIEKLEA